MKRFAGALLLTLWVLPLHAGDAPSGCAWLCGNWILDAGRSESAAAPVDAALQKFKEPKPRRPPRRFPEGPAGVEEPDDFSPPPPPEPPGKASLRSQLLGELTASASLVVGQEDSAILIRAADGQERRIYPGRPHSLTNAGGTTTIKTSWKNNELVVREDRGGRRKFTETFALLADGALQMSRILERPGLKALHVRAVYRRGQTDGIESGAQGRTSVSAP